MNTLEIKLSSIEGKIYANFKDIVHRKRVLQEALEQLDQIGG